MCPFWDVYPSAQPIRAEWTAQTVLPPALKNSARFSHAGGGFRLRHMYLISGSTVAVAGTCARGDWRGSVLDVGEEKTDPARGRLGQSASQLACLR